MRAILTYHSLDDSGSPISLPPSSFLAHCRWLERSDISVVDLEDLLRTPDDEDAVSLTFDDGFVNLEEVAAPLLVERGWPATVFVVPGHVGATNAWGGAESPGIPTLPLLDWEALARLAGTGIRPQAHTLRHPHLTALDDESLEEELAGSRAALEDRLGVESTALAYPYGDVDPRVRAGAERTYRLAVTTRFDVLGPDPDPWALPRLDAYYFPDTRVLESWGTRRFQRYLAWRRGLRAVRRHLGGSP